MRFYRVVITDPANANNIRIPNYNGAPGFSPVAFDPSLSTYTSLNYGMSQYDLGGTNPAAQMVEMDMPVTFEHMIGAADAYIKIYGVGLAEIAQASNLNGLNIEIYGGMAVGLPLANPAQAGLLVSGQVLKAFGNYLPMDQSLSIYVASLGSSASSNQTTGNPNTASTVPAPSTNASPANLTFQWKPGQPLLTPVVQSLQTAYPQYSIAGAVSEGLVWVGAETTGMFANIQQFAQFLNEKSLSIISGYAPPKGSGSYPGVCLTLQNNTIYVSDGTTQTNPKQIQFVDLVGQPAWTQPYTVQVMCVMRFDINCGDYVTLPLVQGTTTSGSNSQFFNPVPGDTYSTQKSGSIFSGTFMVTSVRHVGNSRAADAASWMTVLELIAQTTPTSTVSSLPTLYTGVSPTSSS